MPNKYKISKTIKEYKIKYSNYDITVPIGSIVSNKTACGYDDTYHFWEKFHENIENLTGFKNSMLCHDLTHYGLNIPSEYCEEYK
jgi:hypothetical protein